jgi:hypothetical protein
MKEDKLTHTHTLIFIKSMKTKQAIIDEIKVGMNCTKQRLS